MKIDKRILVIGAVLLVILVITGFMFLRKQPPTDQAEILPDNVAIPTVDSSVTVDLKSLTSNKEISLEVSSIPAGTESVDYELSYQTVLQGLQGVIGTVTLDEGQSIIEKKLTLGTCSSGTCVYHQVVGKIKLTLKFTGNYGEKLYEKEFTI
ncbi:MAG: hypothetical protein UR68_C0001G0011 [Candidatus Roizmanbacteria bacterium GW2011_GWA2_35_19]|uniref:Uncharacterized protein n=2 Tax=Candidatus Roizmaniibacteriota TaxID=1752723 RepID=A0A0G0CEA3_9BACT|nr:MAG: hypothetical protein UR63_C0001G0011 [Candidatus Roizmanbacteria bacterium GW2011_GWC2_35_12]KKP74411.1 MAG: hypothetical protein UR68_C0001G0011 [Candidatus Roizmanbacteria bacterium GW2011_GWA2_35_19]